MPIEDTDLLPDVIADAVVREASYALQRDIPQDAADWIAERSRHLYPKSPQFANTMRRRGNGGRDALYMFMRHWLSGWIRRNLAVLGSNRHQPELAVFCGLPT